MAFCYQGTPLIGHTPFQGTPLPGHTPFQCTPLSRAHPLPGNTPSQGTPLFRAHPLLGHTPFQGTPLSRAHPFQGTLQISVDLASSHRSLDQGNKYSRKQVVPGNFLLKSDNFSAQSSNSIPDLLVHCFRSQLCRPTPCKLAFEFRGLLSSPYVLNPPTLWACHGSEKSVSASYFCVTIHPHSPVP